MSQYLFPLIKREEIAESTMAFWLARLPKPGTGGQETKGSNFNFQAGQHAMFTLINPLFSDSEGNSRTLSFASSPNNRESLVVATRMRQTAFKKSLKEMALGSNIEVGQPVGFFTLQEDSSRPAVFLAGGIGITPFRSMVEFAIQEKLDHKIYLFYSNRTPALTAFLPDFEKWEKENPNFKLVATVTQSFDSPWGYETGRINEKMLKKYLPDLKIPVYYIAGPHAFMVGMYETLTEAGVAQESIKTEEFTGY